MPSTCVLVRTKNEPVALVSFRRPPRRLPPCRSGRGGLRRRSAKSRALPTPDRPPRYHRARRSNPLNKSHFCQKSEGPTTPPGAQARAAGLPGRARGSVVLTDPWSACRYDGNRNKYGRDRMSTCENRAARMGDRPRRGPVRPTADSGLPLWTDADPGRVDDGGQQAIARQYPANSNWGATRGIQASIEIVKPPDPIQPGPGETPQ